MAVKSLLVSALVVALGLVTGCVPSDEVASPLPSGTPTPPSSPASSPTVRHSVVTLKPRAGDDRLDSLLNSDGVKLLQTRLRMAGVQGAVATRVVSGDFEIVFPDVVDEELATRLAGPATLQVKRVVTMGLASDDFACEGANLPGTAKPSDGVKDLTGETVYCLQEPAELTERDVESAVADVREVDPVVTITFNAAGKAALEKLTSELAAAEPGKNMFAFVVDGAVVAAPAVQAVIPDGAAMISGGFTIQTADELAALITFAVLGASFDHSMETVEP